MRVGGCGGGPIRLVGLGGGAMRFEGVLVGLGGSGEPKGTPGGVLGVCGAWLSSSCPESVNVGTPSLGVTADAFGVVSGSVCGLRMVGGGGGGMAALSRSAMAPLRGFTVILMSSSDTESSSLVLLISSVLFLSCDAGGEDDGPKLGACRQEPSRDSSQSGRRKQKRTAEATIRDIPRRAIAHAICAS
jgi:hypothetical protein